MRKTKIRRYLGQTYCMRVERGHHTKIDEKRLVMFERNLQRRIFGPYKRNTESYKYERWTNVELREMFDEPKIS